VNSTLATVLVVAVLGVVALAGGGLLTTLVFRQVDRGDHVAPTDEADSVEAAQEILRGGAWIGVLERTAIYASIVAGWPEGIAVVLAVKSLARYPELQAGKKSAAAERFIIGTFVSTLFACACAGVAMSLIAT
jgi:F0F1-type ATP synthase membrane subunit c/vacuolar-type H+-ATPase subunit K